MSNNPLSGAVSAAVERIEHGLQSRGVRIANAIRNAELDILRGDRHGKTYPVPHSTRTYVASAPGEPPARRTGNLRLHWNMDVKGQKTSTGYELDAGIQSSEAYSKTLEDGTRKTAPRPYRDRIIDKALPEVRRILNEPW